MIISPFHFLKKLEEQLIRERILLFVGAHVLFFMIMGSTAYAQVISSENEFLDIRSIKEKDAEEVALSKTFPSEKSSTAVAKVSFSTAFLAGQRDIDISRFAQGNPVSSGIYDLVIYVNDAMRTRADVLFKAPDNDPNHAAPCFTRGQLDTLGVDIARLSEGEGADLCLPLNSRIPQATVFYDSAEQKLSLSVPQAALRKSAQGYVDPKTWDYGMTAGLLGYNVNTFMQQSNHEKSTTSTFIGIKAGFNIGSWQLRHNSSGHIATGQSSQWQNINTYAVRPLADWQALFQIGEGNTSGEFFDGLSYRGVQLSSDDRMLPDSLRGFAPVVRGVANSNAKVEIFQNNFLLQQLTVSPGPFEITDLPATGSGGDLRVVITEANGLKREFTVPFASVAQLLRPGARRYSVSAGQLRVPYLDSSPWVVQGTWQQGINNTVTAYTGVQLSDGYGAGLLGMALSTQWGAFSTDITHAQTSLPEALKASQQGQRLRLGYSKIVEKSNTYISLSASRNLSSGYLGLNQALLLHSRSQGGGFDWNAGAMGVNKQNISLSVNQPLLGNWGSLYVTATSSKLEGNSQSDLNYQLGYSRSFGSVTMSVGAGRSRFGSVFQNNGTQYSVNFSMPLGVSAASPQLSVNLNQSEGNNSQQAFVSGAIGEDRNLSYGISASHTSGTGGGSTSGGLSAQHQGRFANTSASYSQGTNYRSGTLGIAGSAVLHEGGVTLSQQTGDTIALVEAPGAVGAKVVGVNNMHLDKNGYAVLPFLTPYRMNTVEVDPQGANDDVEFKTTSKKVAPYAGAVVKVKLETLTGRAAFIHALDENGQALRFGSQVLDAEGQVRGVVGQASQLYVRDIDDQGVLMVRWGSKPNEQCKIAYQLPPKTAGGNASQLDARCVGKIASVVPVGTQLQ